MNIAIVVPIFNEGERSSQVAQELLKQKLTVIFVDDGSTDQTFEKLKQIEKINKIDSNRIKILKHKVNLGKGAALKTGCEAAFILGHKAVILMDSDGQHKVEDLPKFIGEINSGKYDIIFGSRTLGKRIPLDRLLGNKIARVLIKLMFGTKVTDPICGYRALTKEAFEKLNWRSLGYGVDSEMVIRSDKMKLRTKEVPVETVYEQNFKGTTFADGFSVLFDILRWRFEI